MDAPARAHFKNVKMCSGYSGCDWDGRVIYLSTDGVGKKLLYAYMWGNFSCRQPLRTIEAISDTLVFVEQFTPKMFSRRPRRSSFLHHFKATEIGLFLLYSGIYALKDQLSSWLYSISFCYHVLTEICVILHCPDHILRWRRLNRICNDLLKNRKNIVRTLSLSLISTVFFISLTM